MRVIEQILDLARWAPSGDNTQPWRFEILADDHVLVHGFDTRHWCVYDLDGHASQIAVGALLETLSIAATGWGLRADIVRRADTPDTHLLLDVVLVPDPSITPDGLMRHIKTRSVQRRAMSRRSLTEAEKHALEQAAKPHRIVWFESQKARTRIAKLNFDSAKIRLTIPEAFETHSRVIEWGAQFSDDRIPEAAVGVDPLTAKVMAWVMQDWQRVEFFNKWFFGTLAPRLQLDLFPGIACSAHAFMIAPTAPKTVDDRIVSGRAVQRLWLTAESLGLQSQPEMTPLIFNRYAREERNFTSNAWARSQALELAARLSDLLEGNPVEHTVWACRLGAASALPGRSLRLPVSSLRA